MNKSDTHKYTPEKLGAYYDGQMSEVERIEMEQHLKQCPACQAILTELSLVDSSVQKAEGVSVPEGYFQTFGSAVANRITRQMLEPQKQAKKFSWGWVTATAALASLTIVLISGDLTKPRLYRSVPEEQKTVLSEIPVDMKATDEALSEKAGSSRAQSEPARAVTPPTIEPDNAVPGEQARGAQPSPMPIPAEAPAEKALEAATPAKPAATTEVQPQMAMTDISPEKEAPAKRAKDKASAGDAKTARYDDFAGAGLASAPAQAPTKTRAPDEEQVPAPAPTPVLARTQAPAPASAPIRSKTPTRPAVTALEQGPAKVDNVTVIVICLPDGEKDCPEPKVTSAIRISLDGD